MPDGGFIAAASAVGSLLAGAASAASVGLALTADKPQIPGGAAIQALAKKPAAAPAPAGGAVPRATAQRRAAISAQQRGGRAATALSEAGQTGTLG